MRPLTMTVMSFAAIQQRYGRASLADVRLHLTPEALQAILDQLGPRPPEAGCKLFGPRDRHCVDVVEYDELGSANATRTVYSPDADWGTARVRHWLAQTGSEMRLWHGDAHSHPGEMGIPSAAAGVGQGDVGYCALVLQRQELRQDFFIPILTGTGTPEVRLWSWVVSRDCPDEARYAEVVVGPVSEMPPRRLNPEYERKLNAAKKAPEPTLLLIRLNLDEVAALTRTVLSIRGTSFSFARDDCAVELSLPEGFPAKKPSVMLHHKDDGDLPFVFRWRTTHPHRAELRLKALIGAALKSMSKEF